MAASIANDAHAGSRFVNGQGVYVGASVNHKY